MKSVLVRGIRAALWARISVRGTGRNYLAGALVRALAHCPRGAADLARYTVSMTTRISDATRARIAAAWPAILLELARGALVGATLRAYDISPDEMRAFRALPGMQAEWESAREDSADAFMDEAMECARNPVQIIPQGEGKEPLIIRVDPAHARNRIDTLKWAARIRNPRLYSDKAQLDINVKTVDLTRIIGDANARLAAARGRPLELTRGADGVYALPAELLALM